MQWTKNALLAECAELGWDVPTRNTMPMQRQNKINFSVRCHRLIPNDQLIAYVSYLVRISHHSEYQRLTICYEANDEK